MELDREKLQTFKGGELMRETPFNFSLLLEMFCV